MIPLLSHARDDAVLAWKGDRPVTVAAFLGQVAALAAQLPARPHLVNLCADRYHFMLGFAAAMVRGQVSLLPPGAAPAVLRQFEQTFPGLYALTDAPMPECPLQVIDLTTCLSEAAAGPMPAFAPTQIAVIAFTSGSTGKPSAHPKSWASLVQGAKAEAQALGLAEPGDITVVGTVPAQHMYGLESTVLLALHNGFAVHGQRPFYPADVRRALAEIPPARVLVTTPVHLRALLADEQLLPPLRLIVCATAPLSIAMAAEAERRFATVVLEVYGFTEAGQVATRRTTQGSEWQTMPGVNVRAGEAGAWFAGGHVAIEAQASDVIDVHDARRFVLQGRSADMVNVAGKRASLEALNRELVAVDGVEDGVFFVPEDSGERIQRLIAFVVAPGGTADTILRALRSRIDPAFLPRPLYLVPCLPRNATGKLPREALMDLAQACAAAPARR